MKISEVRNWIGKYYLLLTCVLGAYILLFGGSYSKFLRIDQPTAVNCFHIIVPTLLGQVALIFKFFGGDRGQNETICVDLPTWVVKWPPIIVALLIVATILLHSIRLKRTLCDFMDCGKNCVTMKKLGWELGPNRAEGNHSLNKKLPSCVSV